LPGAGRLTAADGTIIAFQLHPGDSRRTPLLCLPGLTRHSGDFAPVVQHFLGTRPILTIDLRGRGKSSWAAANTYKPDVELQDVIGVLDQLNVPRVALLGTSRGGLIGMLMAALHRDRLAGLVLNDIGPRLEPEGLLRICGYVGAIRHFATWDDAAQAFADSQSGFRHLTAAQWIAAVRRIYGETPAGIAPLHDPALALSLPSAEDINAGKVPELWALLPALQGLPISLLRGEFSDLLSTETVARSQAAVEGMEAVVVRDRGHAPFLDEPESLAAITRWLARCDSKHA
jgi:pimeloyl-ACP methyl ester carboxylesterase